MKRSPFLSLYLFVAIAVGLFAATVVAGNEPRLGLDLQGGVSVVLQPVPVAGQKDVKVTTEALEQTKTIIERRVNAIGVGEPEILVQGKTIVVQLPGIRDQKRALALVGETAEMRFRPVLEDLPPGLSDTQRRRMTTLRKKLKIPKGVSALQVYNDEQAKRGLPTAPDPSAPTTNETITSSDEAVPTSTGVATTAAPPSTAPASGEGTGGRSSAKVAALRRQSAPTTPSTAPQVVPGPGAGEATTTTTPAPTTTMNPAPVNQYGIPVYGAADGSPDKDFQELLTLEQQETESKTALTPSSEDDPKKEVVLEGSESSAVDGVLPRYRLGPSLLTGKALETATAGLSQQGQWEVRPTFRRGPKGIDLFNKAAAKCYSGDPTCPTLSGAKHGRLAIVLDSVVLTTPSINEASFARDQITISGSFTEQEAKDVALSLRYGSLPVTLKAQQVQTVSATLGKGALEAAIIAGLLGLALVAFWMIFYYRLLGAVTLGALALSAMFLWTIVGFFGETQGLTLSLSGVVGIIVSIGVSLDSSVVYFENLKEDVRHGRSLRATVDRSFSTAFATTVKADVSSLIGAVILYLLSVGPVRGFAFFLGLSTLLDLFTSYFFTRPVVARLGRSSSADHPRRFGIPVDDLPDTSEATPRAAQSEAIDGAIPPRPTRAPSTRPIP